jgi:hypothetical protein
MSDDSKSEPVLFKQRTDYPGVQAAYTVWLDGVMRGYVWKQRGFSYRGTQGWNRGIRCKDFHPIEWRYGPHIGGRAGLTCISRAAAIARLLETRKEPA